MSGSKGGAAGGQMQYALGTDDETAPETGWRTTVPTATYEGTYYVWYKAAGENAYTDSEAAVIEVTVYPDFETDFILPSAARVIEAGAFEGNGSITAVDASRCTEIGDDAFRNCTTLRQVRLPKDCEISDSAFDGCDSRLVAYGTAGGTSQDWAIRHGIPFIEYDR